MSKDVSLPAWADLVSRVRGELDRLPADERDWLEQRLAAIAGLQGEIDGLFHQVDGGAACAVCQGGCCGSGRHHLTLTNLLACLCAGKPAPPLAAAATCPLLGPQGCRLDAARRPFNCITFFCEALDARLGPAGRERLAALERRLRAEYEAVAGRYPAASLRGLWIALERHGNQPLLGAASAVILNIPETATS